MHKINRNFFCRTTYITINTILYEIFHNLVTVGQIYESQVLKETYIKKNFIRFTNQKFL